MFMMIQAIVKIIVQSSAVSLSSLDDDNDEKHSKHFQRIIDQNFRYIFGPRTKNRTLTFVIRFPCLNSVCLRKNIDAYNDNDLVGNDDGDVYRKQDMLPAMLAARFSWPQKSARLGSE